MPQSVTFWVYSYNMKCNPVQGPAKITDEMVMLAKQFGLRAIGGIQENNGTVPWYKSIPKKILKHEVNIANNNCNTPIYVGKHWQITSSYFVKVVSGVKHFTPTRGVSVATTKMSSIECCTLNQHPINRGGHIPKANRQTAKRDKLRQAQWDAAQQEAMRWMVLGYPVFITADFNDRTVEEYHPTQRWLYQNGIDKIGYIPADGYKLRVIKKLEKIEGVGRNHSDHPLIGVLVELTKV